MKKIIKSSIFLFLLTVASSSTEIEAETLACGGSCDPNGKSVVTNDGTRDCRWWSDQCHRGWFPI